MEMVVAKLALPSIVRCAQWHSCLVRSPPPICSMPCLHVDGTQDAVMVLRFEGTRERACATSTRYLR
eukprot:5067766-Amphidinium_carterae.1